MQHSVSGKSLKSQLLEKLSIEFYETQDLSSPNGKPKLLFYDYSWHFLLISIFEALFYKSIPNYCQLGLASQCTIIFFEENTYKRAELILN